MMYHLFPLLKNHQIRLYNSMSVAKGRAQPSALTPVVPPTKKRTTFAPSQFKRNGIKRRANGGGTWRTRGLRQLRSTVINLQQPNKVRMGNSSYKTWDCFGAFPSISQELFFATWNPTSHLHPFTTFGENTRDLTTI